jgi:hypothetical protein
MSSGQHQRHQDEFGSSTASLYIFSNTIPIMIQQDCVSPSEERLTGSQRELKPTAQSSTEFRHKPMIDAFNAMSGRMVVWEELRAWHGLASVFCLLFVFCLFFNGLVFDGRDNALEEC